MIGTVIHSLFFRASLFWLAFHRAPEREFRRLLLEAMDEASFDMVLNEMVSEIEQALND